MMNRAIGGMVVVLWIAWLALGAGKAPPPTQPATQPSSQPVVELTLDLGNKVTMKLALIPAGKFMMGSPGAERDRLRDEGPQREVTISRSFYMGIYHVTRGQFAAFVADSGYKTDAERNGLSNAWNGSKVTTAEGASWRNPGFEQPDDHPAVCINHSDATAFCDWLSKRTGKPVALPTEAQREYACRAGTTTAYQWGDNPDDGKGWCNAADQSAKKQIPNLKAAFSWDDGYVFTSPVGKFKPNAFGLHDMHGNVREWCSDWYEAKYYANAKDLDPQGPASGQLRVLRGGSWNSGPRNCRSALRSWVTSEYHTADLGFRVCVVLK